MENVIDPSWRPPQLESERLCLRPFCETDVEALFAIASNPNVTRYTLWEAHQSPNVTRSFLRGYAQERFVEQVPDAYGVFLKANGALIGGVGAHWASRADHCMEFGYWIAEPFWGRGFAAEAARTLLNHVFAKYDVERAQAHFIDGNDASGKVMTKLGLKFEGVRRHGVLHRGVFKDIYCFAVLRSEWNAAIQ